MKGIQYLVDDTGEKTAVVIDLQQWGELWADFQDILVSRSRIDEPKVSWEDLQAEMDMVRVTRVRHREDVYRD